MSCGAGGVAVRLLEAVEVQGKPAVLVPANAALACRQRSRSHIDLITEIESHAGFTLRQDEFDNLGYVAR